MQKLAERPPPSPLLPLPPAKSPYHLEREPQDRLVRLPQLIQFLFHGIFFGFERDNGSELFAQGIKTALGLVRCEGQEFCHHEEAEDFDIVVVGEAGEEAVVEVRRREAREGGVEESVEGFVGGLKGEKESVRELDWGIR